MQVRAYRLEQGLRQRGLVRRLLQQRIGHGGQAGLALVAADHVGHAYRRIASGQAQCTARDRDFAEVEAFAGAACAALDHHQPGFGPAQPAHIAVGVVRQCGFQQTLRRACQQAHPGLPVQGPVGLRIVKCMKHVGGTL
ncbi:hypothetical protein D3C78_1292980 [compost metagenome]